jgi:SAM-dependent methyltransferase
MKAVIRAEDSRARVSKASPLRTKQSMEFALARLMTAAAPATPSCRFCDAALDRVMVDLGVTPLANSNPRPEEADDERKYPLICRVCPDCLLVQVDDSVPPGEIFSDYPYFSSYSAGWVAHAARYCDDVMRRFSITRDSFVVEIASNDGYLLQHFMDRGVGVLGVEPAQNVAAAARAKGIATETAFFGLATAKRLSAAGRKADLMVANNVLAHAPETRDFVAGFAELLAPEGVATFEFPHLLNLIEKVQFDTIYHEHFFYLSYLSAERIMAAAGLRIFDVEELPTHGGSLRLFVCHASARHPVSARTAALRQRERDRALDRIAGYAGFTARVAETKRAFLEYLAEARRAGRKVAAYGAAAKGNTFLNVCGVTYPQIEAVYDLSTQKQGRLTPGSHIPILPPARIAELKPDDVLILPWNLADEITRALPEVRSWGGRFVVAVPAPRFL